MRISDWSSDVCSSDLHRESADIITTAEKRGSTSSLPQDRKNYLIKAAQTTSKVLCSTCFRFDKVVSRTWPRETSCQNLGSAKIRSPDSRLRQGSIARFSRAVLATQG